MAITNEVLDTERWRACVDEARKRLDACTDHEKKRRGDRTGSL